MKELSFTNKAANLYKIAFLLAVLTVFYNFAEGILATYFGYSDDSLALLGFGVDSFIELISGFGIAHLVWRIWRKGESHRDSFERLALQITGVAFYLLVVGLIAGAVYSWWTQNKPETTFWGVIVSLVSVFVMAFLIAAKKNVGEKLNSEAIIADANCTKICLYMSFVLLASSAFFELTQIGYFDIIGTLGIAFLAFREGRECFEKAAGKVCCSCEND